MVEASARTGQGTRVPVDGVEQAALDAIDVTSMVALVHELISCAGENPGSTEQRTVDVISRALAAVGATVHLDEVVPGRPNLVAHLGGGNTGGGLLFLGHSDVVPAGPGWDADPFVARTVDGRIYGRGATDMLGGIAAVIAAMAVVNSQAPDIPLSLIVTVDEEADATGIAHYIRTQSQSGYTGCIVAEPTNLAVVVGCRGAANLRVRFTGSSAHAGWPADGASAIQAAAAVVALLREDAQRLTELAHSQLGPATWNVGTITGGHGVSIVPDTAELGIDRRLLPGEDPQEVLDGLLRRVPRALAESDVHGREHISFSGDVDMYMPGFLTRPDNTFSRITRSAVRDVGGTGEYEVWTASCEGGFIAEHHGIPVLILGPGEITTQAHQPNESVSVDDLCTAARAYALLALRHP